MRLYVYVFIICLFDSFFVSLFVVAAVILVASWDVVVVVIGVDETHPMFGAPQKSTQQQQTYSL